MTEENSVSDTREFLCYQSIDMAPIVIKAENRDEILVKYPRLLVMGEYETIENYDRRGPPLPEHLDPAEVNARRMKKVLDIFRFDIDEDPKDSLAIQYGQARNMECYLCCLNDKGGNKRYFYIWATESWRIPRVFPEAIIIPKQYGLVPPDDPSWGARHYVLDFPAAIKRILDPDYV